MQNEKVVKIVGRVGQERKKKIHTNDRGPQDHADSGWDSLEYHLYFLNKPELYIQGTHYHDYLSLYPICNT